MFEKIKKIFSEKDEKRKTENLILFLIILIVTLIVINKILDGSKKTEIIDEKSGAELVTKVESEIENVDEYDLETRLEDILSKISGVGEVDVLLTYSETTSNSPLYNESLSESISTSENGETTETKTESKEIFTDSQNEAVIQKQIYPKLEGAIVIAKGAGNTSVKTNIIYAVEAATGLLTHKIQIFEMK